MGVLAIKYIFIDFAVPKIVIWFLLSLSKTGFWYKNAPIWICVCVLWIHNGYFIVKKMVSNPSI